MVIEERDIIRLQKKLPLLITFVGALSLLALIPPTFNELSESKTAHALTAPSSPLTPTSKKLYIDTDSTQATYTRSNPSEANTYISSQPAARWFGGWSDVRSDISSYVQRAATTDAAPVAVLYNIPHRDCGSYSGGGTSDNASYLNWIKQAREGIGSRPAMVVLEPDALAGMDCLSENDKKLRLSAIKQAVDILQRDKTSVYIDAGNPDWHSAREIASRLRAANIYKATGFSLNVSNFHTTGTNTSYGKSISALAHNKHFVIDTSRNGNGPTETNEWCNPRGRTFGNTPTFSTGQTLIDGYLWIKTPGESDGDCGNGAPKAGEWWQEYADELYSLKH